MPKLKEGTARIVKERLAELIAINGYDQGSFAKILSERTGRPLVSSNISLWLTGKREVPLKYTHHLMDIFGVTDSYLYGFTDDPHGVISVNEKTSNEPRYQITMAQLYAYDKKPVYVDFGLYTHNNGWAIYNRRRRTFIFTEDILRESFLKDIGAKLYVRDVADLRDPLLHRKSLDYKGLMDAEDGVYVIMTTTNVAIQSLYDGWYHHNENHSALINNDGLVLPYDGLKKAYLAYAYNYKANA